MYARVIYWHIKSVSFMLKYCCLNNLSLSFSLLTIPFIISCKSSAVLMKEYSGQSIYGKNLTVIALFDKPIIANRDDIDELGFGVEEDVYKKYFNE